jgi:hypothetical protein
LFGGLANWADGKKKDLTANLPWNAIFGAESAKEPDAVNPISDFEIWFLLDIFRQ